MSDRIEAAIARVPHWRGLKTLRYERIEGGLTNQSYRVAIDEEQFALRINAPNSMPLALDRHHECQVLNAADRAGIGPEVVYCSPEEGLLVTRWIEGSPWSLADIRKAQNIERLAGRLRDIHALPPTGKAFHPVASIRRYAALAREAGITLPREAMELERRVKSKSSAIVEPTHLCHNDIVHTNIIDTGSLRVVDWEYAATGDPLFDVATVARYHHFSAAQTDMLLECYAGDVSRSHRARLATLQTLFDTLHLFWLLAQKARARRDVEIDERIERLLEFLRNPP